MACERGPPVKAPWLAAALGQHHLGVWSLALKLRAAITLAEDELEDEMPILNKCVPGDI